MNHKTNEMLRAFAAEVTSTLLDGNRHQTPGLGTFPTNFEKQGQRELLAKWLCFGRARSLERMPLVDHYHSCPRPHAELVSFTVEAMQMEQGVDVPLLGRMAVVPVVGKKPKLISNGAQELNDVLAGSC